MCLATPLCIARVPGTLLACSSDSDGDVEGPLHEQQENDAAGANAAGGTGGAAQAGRPGEGPLDGADGKGKAKAPRPKLTYGHLTVRPAVLISLL